MRIILSYMLAGEGVTMQEMMDTKLDLFAAANKLAVKAVGKHPGSQVVFTSVITTVEPKKNTTGSSEPTSA